MWSEAALPVKRTRCSTRLPDRKSLLLQQRHTAQLAAMYCLAVQLAKVREKITEEQYSYYISELLTIPEKMKKILEDKERIQWFAAKYANAHDVFFVGRGIDYAVCLEGSLKLKEISYIHSEAYAAGTSIPFSSKRSSVVGFS